MSFNFSLPLYLSPSFISFRIAPPLSHPTPLYYLYLHLFPFSPFLSISFSLHPVTSHPLFLSLSLFLYPPLRISYWPPSLYTSLIKIRKSLHPYILFINLEYSPLPQITFTSALSLPLYCVLSFSLTHP